MPDFLHQPMSRKQFLIYLGLIVLSVTGVSGLLTRISHPLSLKSKVTSGFGKGAYGS